MSDREINKFIKAVTKDMGWKQRNEIKSELRTHILDSAEALAAERNVPVDDSIIEEVIRKMGPPEEITAIYPPGGKNGLPWGTLIAWTAITIITIAIIIGAVLMAALFFAANHG